MGAKDLKWFRLADVTDEKRTIRDYILYCYAENQLEVSSVEDIRHTVLACPLSFDITSNAKAFEIDHFYPKDTILERIELLESNQAFLRQVKEKLRMVFLRNSSEDGYTNKIVEKLIPIQNGSLATTGLKQLYFNYPHNLWPISGPANSAKGKKEALEFAIVTILDNMRLHVGDHFFNLLTQQIIKELEQDPDTISDKSVKERQAIIIELLYKNFELHCDKHGINETNSILPFFLSSQDGHIYHITLLQFLKSTPLGEAATNYSRETAKNGLRAIKLARIIAANMVSADPFRQSVATGIAASLRHVERAAKSILDSGTESEGSEPGSLDSVGIQTVEFVGETFDIAIAEAKAHKNEKETANATQKMKRKYHAILQEHPIENLGIIHKIDGDGNCFFRAIAHELERQGLGTYTHQELRRQAIQYLIDHIDIFQENPLEHEEDVTDYLERMAQDQEYAEQHILDALAKTLNIQLTIILSFRRTKSLIWMQ